MYVCMYVCTYVCMCVSVCVCMCVCVCMHVCMCVYVYIYIYIYVCVCVCVCVCVYVCVYVCTYVCVYVCFGNSIRFVNIPFFCNRVARNCSSRRLSVNWHQIMFLPTLMICTKSSKRRTSYCCLNATSQIDWGTRTSSAQPASIPAPNDNSVIGMCVTWRLCAPQLAASWGNPWPVAFQWRWMRRMDERNRLTYPRIRALEKSARRSNMALRWSLN